MSPLIKVILFSFNTLLDMEIGNTMVMTNEEMDNRKFY